MVWSAPNRSYSEILDDHNHVAHERYTRMMRIRWFRSLYRIPATVDLRDVAFFGVETGEHWPNARMESDWIPFSRGIIGSPEREPMTRSWHRRRKPRRRSKRQ